MELTFEAACEQIAKAHYPEDLFGPGGDEHLKEARNRYHALVRAVHPDTAPGDQIDRAHAAVAKVNALWGQYKKGMTGGFEVSTKTRTYSVEDIILRDEISNYYPCSWDDGGDQYGMLRLPRSPRDNDLIQAEAKALKALDKGIARFRPYAPEMVENFRFREAATKVDRQAIVTRRLEGFSSLTEVHDAYPDGIDGRDAAWMWRRCLVGAGWAHQAGVIHGAILPQNVLIQPLQHGIVFINWAYSVTEEGQRVQAVVPGFETWYPQHVTEKRPAIPGIDIFMIAECMIYLLGDRAPTQFRAFAKGCAAHGFAEWNSDQAWEIQREFDELLQKLYGKRRFRPFEMPEMSES